MITTTAAVDQVTPTELAGHPVFEGLAVAPLASALRDVRTRRREAGETVCGPGGRAALHLVLSGRLCLYEVTTDGRRVILDFLDAGGVDGMLELAGLGGHFSAAVEASHVASVPPPVLDRIAQVAPGFSFNLLKVTIRRLRRREDQLERLALRDPDQRIADQLLALAEASGPSGQGAAPLSAPRVSHEALADMLALRRETVTLHLGRMRRLGAVRVDRHRFVLDRARLEAIREGHPLRYASASGLSARPSPGRAGSGASSPPDGRGAPSNSSDSSRTWSWKYSTSEICGTPQAACAWMDGAVWAEKRTCAE